MMENFKKLLNDIIQEYEITLLTPFGEYPACTKTIDCLSKDIFNTLLLDGQCDIKMHKLKDVSKN